LWLRIPAQRNRYPLRIEILGQVKREKEMNIADGHGVYQEAKKSWPKDALFPWLVESAEGIGL
jgi:hypothetical protein